MATTTNFGWETPDDTDLVKDGAAAMRTLGNSIDTSFVDLKGGTTGQILSKASNTDLDYTWITNDIGDITAVTAGTGISGGGSSGAVTITNSMATAIDAKGDLIGGTGADTFDRLAVGTNGQVLTADSTATTGMKWATPSSGGTMTTWTGFDLKQGTTTFNPTSASRYTTVGDWVWCQLVLYLDNQTGQSNTGITFNLPISGVGSDGEGICAGTVQIYDGSASTFYQGNVVITNSIGTFRSGTNIALANRNWGTSSSQFPIQLANGDEVRATFSYRKA